MCDLEQITDPHLQNKDNFVPAVVSRRLRSPNTLLAWGWLPLLHLLLFLLWQNIQNVTFINFNKF